MRRNRFQKAYDVKTFLNKKKTRSGFVSFTFTRSSINVFVFVVILCFLPTILFFSQNGFVFMNYVIRAGVRDALPFFESDRLAKKISISDIVVSRGVSPLFLKKETTEIEETKIDLPEVNIESKSDVSQEVKIKNETSYSVDVKQILKEPLSLKTQNPKVLIVHTHGSESYTTSIKYPYEQTGNYRTQDTNYNMIRIGEEIARHIRAKGIEVIHDKTINDYPSYNDSYNKAQRVIEGHINKDSDIVFVFDIHRDAVGEGNNVVKFVSNVNGKTAAQVMMVCGTDTNLENPKWQENLKLAVHIQNKIEADYPGFLRPLNLRKERFNMHLTTGSILFEVGTNGNTLDEALVSSSVLGDELGDMILSLQSPDD